MSLINTKKYVYGSILFIGFLLVIFINVCSAGLNTFKNGEVADAAKVNQNFTTLDDDIDSLETDIATLKTKDTKLDERVTKLETNDSNNSVNYKYLDNFKVLATANNMSEEAKIKFSANGVEVETDYYDDNVINTVLFNWPEEISEIIFEVRNHFDSYCVGGGGKQNLLKGVGTNAKCTRYSIQGKTHITNTMEHENWIRLSVNNINMDKCMDSQGIEPKEDYPGRDGWPQHNVYCIYKKEDWNNGVVDSITVEEVDWSKGYGAWDWKIWYK